MVHWIIAENNRQCFISDVFGETFSVRRRANRKSDSTKGISGFIYVASTQCQYQAEVRCRNPLDKTLPRDGWSERNVQRTKPARERAANGSSRRMVARGERERAANGSRRQTKWAANKSERRMRVNGEQSGRRTKWAANEAGSEHERATNGSRRRSGRRTKSGNEQSRTTNKAGAERKQEACKASGG